MMNTHIHGGKWSEEEELYADALIEAFKAGELPVGDIEEGTSLRKYLSKKLMCSPKRISKKYEGTNYNGKQVYFRNRATTGPTNQGLALQARLQILEHQFLKTLSDSKAVESSAPRPEPRELGMYSQLQLQSINDASLSVANSIYAAAPRPPLHAAITGAPLPSTPFSTVARLPVTERSTSQGSSNLGGLGAFFGSASSSLMPQIPQDQELARMAAAFGNQLRLPPRPVHGDAQQALPTSSTRSLAIGSQLPAATTNPNLMGSLGSTRNLLLEAAQLQQLQQLQGSLLQERGLRASGTLPSLTRPGTNLDVLRNTASATSVSNEMGLPAAAALRQTSTSAPNPPSVVDYLKERAGFQLGQQQQHQAAPLPAPAVELLGSTAARVQLLANQHNRAVQFPSETGNLSQLIFARGQPDTQGARSTGSTGKRESNTQNNDSSNKRHKSG